jgi:large subunit ribosomal protein L10
VLRSEKKQFVENLERVCKDSAGIFVTHYHGMTVTEVLKLKKSLKSKEVYFKVVKNTLMKIAAKNVGRNEIIDMFSGPVAVAYSNDVVAAAKLLDNFSKENENLKIVGGSISGSVVSASEIREIAKLPSFEEIRAKLIAVIQTPAVNIARVLNAPAENVARVLSAYAQK